MVFLLKKLPHVPESDPLNGIHDVKLEVPTETMQFVSEAVSEVINKTGSALKDTYLFKNIKKSLYFAVSMYCLTLIGALFNFSTVLILTWIGLFTIPKLYSNNQRVNTFLGLPLNNAKRAFISIVHSKHCFIS